MNILVLGVTGMLGNTIFRFLSTSSSFAIYGSARYPPQYLGAEYAKNIISGVDVEDNESLLRTFNLVKPDVVINCIGVIKQLIDIGRSERVVSINALLPYRLETICQDYGARLIHFSTDCVFSGKCGNYHEEDVADAGDLYGRSKLLGEVISGTSLTLRTSIIGHELTGSNSLIDWFLNQKQVVKGYRRAIFSGLPTVEIARIIRDYILENIELRGLYHLSASPINKYDLLKEVAIVYDKKIEILADDEIVIDRSLNSSRFRSKTGYTPDEWPNLIRAMHGFG